MKLDELAGHVGQVQLMSLFEFLAAVLMGGVVLFYAGATRARGRRVGNAGAVIGVLGVVGGPGTRSAQHADGHPHCGDEGHHEGDQLALRQAGDELADEEQDHERQGRQWDEPGPEPGNGEQQQGDRGGEEEEEHSRVAALSKVSSTATPTEVG